MKLLVTGGAGFIGSHFIRHILQEHQEDEVVNLDVLTYAGNLENLSDVEHNSRYRFVRGDICDASLVNELVKEVDAIVHFAAESHVDRSILDAGSFVRTNVIGTHTLLEAARKNGNVRFHHVSTDEVFGSLGPNDQPFNERTPYDPRSPYSASKAASDHLVRAYFHTHALPITISNCSNNYGPFHFPEKLIPLAITNVIEGKKVPLYGDGKNIRDWLYVTDHCRAIDCVLRGGTIGDTYCIGGGSEKTNREVLDVILRSLGRDQSSIEMVSDRPGHDRRYAIQFKKMTNEFGWRPSVSFDDGIRKTVEWYQQHESWWKRVKSGEYQEYYKKQYKTQ